MSDGRAWGRHRVDDEVRLEVGPLELRLRSQSDELWIAQHREGEGNGAEADDPWRADNWTRWAAADSSDVLVLPALPDRSVVVAPETPFRMIPGANARIFVRIPLWVRIAFADNDELALVEAPTVVMSDTWWGDFASGDLAYWLPTTARRRISDDLFQPHLIMCPLALANESAEVLSVEKLSVRVPNMPVFGDGPKLWSAETRVTYEAADDGSRVDIDERPPREASDAELLTPPRDRHDHGLRARTFGRLMALTQW